MGRIVEVSFSGYESTARIQLGYLKRISPQEFAQELYDRHSDINQAVGGRVVTIGSDDHTPPSWALPIMMRFLRGAYAVMLETREECIVISSQPCSVYKIGACLSRCVQIGAGAAPDHRG